MADRFLDVWVTCPDRAAADRIAEACVAERLAACANVLAPASSIYRWDGAVERADEVPLVFKTRAALFDRLAARIRTLHPYEVPAIVATALSPVEPACAAWLRQETRED